MENNIIIKELEINKTNISKVSTNSKRCYILGIGWTNYTIHKEADELKHYYNNTHGFFKDFSINLMHNYHVSVHNIKTLVDDTKFKEVITLQDKKYQILDAYYGLKYKIRLYIKKGGCREIDKLMSSGEELSKINEKIKIVLHLKEID